ncbi:hypothetical protein D3C80_584460 [compost metagenome]
MAEWVPMPNNARSISKGIWVMMPMAPTAMIAISASLITRISASLAYFSPNCPASAENRKNGRMNIKAQALTQMAVSWPWGLAIL